MNEKTPNRRTLKTRRALCEALAELLAEKELHKVTVQEIADKADVNRVTFYKHYLDVYDLYEKIEKRTLAELGLLALKLEELPEEEFASCLVEYVSENRAVFKMVFSPNSTGLLRAKLSRLIEGIFLQIASEQNGTNLHDKDLIYRSCYRTQGCLAILSKWVQGDFREAQDFIIQMISDLDSAVQDA